MLLCARMTEVSMSMGWYLIPLSSMASSRAPTTNRASCLSVREETQITLMQQAEAVGWGNAVGEETDLRWRRWARCGGGSPGSPSWPRPSECLRNWVWSWSDRTGGPPRRNRCSNRCRYERCAPRSAGGTEDTTFSRCITNFYQLLFKTQVMKSHRDRKETTPTNMKQTVLSLSALLTWKLSNTLSVKKGQPVSEAHLVLICTLEICTFNPGGQYKTDRSCFLLQPLFWQCGY